MKKVFALILFLSVFSLMSMSQIVDRGVRIKILHQKHKILDTVIYEKDQQAIKSIERIVSQYTNEPIYIDASQVRELYVFSFETIKAPNRPEPIVVNIDSIMNSIITKIEKVANDPKVNAIKDSIKHSVHEMKQAIKAIDKSDVQKAKDDFNEFVDKVRETRVIIIQEGDTIKIPSK